MEIGAWERSFIERQRVARLATVGGKGQPHLVPIVFAFDGQKLYSPIDAKPKRASPQQLQRVRDIRDNPRVAVLMDEYSEDWQALAWLQIRGTAAFVEAGTDWETGARLLTAKYPQYNTMPLLGRAMIVISIKRIVHWRLADRSV